MKNDLEQLSELQNSFTVKLQPDPLPNFDMQPDSILLGIEFLSNGVVIWQDEEPLVDAFADNTLSRTKLKYRLSYFSKHLENVLADAALKLYNESGLAAEIAKGDLRDPLTAQKVRKDWDKFLPKDAKTRLSIPKRKRGRKQKLEGKTRANFDQIYERQRARFEDAMSRASLYKKAFPSRRQAQDKDWLDRWREIAGTIIGDVPRSIVDKLVLEPCNASDTTYEYLASVYDSGPTHLAKLVTQARKTKSSLKKS